jgi:DNA-damage-inducible protein J
MATKSIQIRLEEKLKKRVEKVLDDLGMDVPTAVRIFFVQVAATGGIPFSLSGREERYPQHVIDAIDEMAAEAERGEGISRSFDSMEEMLKDLRA